MRIIVFYWEIAPTLSIQLDRALSVGENSLPIVYIYICPTNSIPINFSESRNPYTVRDIFERLIGLIRVKSSVVV